ncbi:MAG: hypothetical protein HY783_08115, partial [Chloroflexi bacterium]|nr:hypothetical protein [Chloroflexota bacterium]
GWTAEEMLYYRAECGKKDPQVWGFAPGRDERPQPVASAPPNLVVGWPREPVLNWVRSPGIWPAKEEPNVRRVTVQESGVASPDARWVAVVARHIYGPEDVVVLTQSSPPDRKGVAHQK